jgi:hypothetical protein
VSNVLTSCVLVLVTTLGALSVVITAVLSAIFLKERLSMVGKVSCFLCLVGAVVIVLNAPQQSAVANIQQMQSFVVHPLFLTYAGLIIVGSVICAYWAGPRWGKKNMLVYLSICSWVGGLSVVATQGLGAAIVTQAEGTPQFNQWFLYVVLVFVIGTLLVEIVFLNVCPPPGPPSSACPANTSQKALNLFNAAMVTPTYYVYFTSATIITSAILFRGFRGSGEAIASVVMGFLTICCGVVLLQLSKSAKDVPDTAVFSGNLDQIQTIAEQEQSETDPKADAIRGTAAIVRRISHARLRMEAEEVRRLHEEKRQEQLAPVAEDGGPVYEWDGLRRRKTVNFGSQSGRPRSATTGTPFTVPRTPEAHPPLGMSRFPTEEEENRPPSPGMLSSFAGTIRSRGRSIISNNPPDFSHHKQTSPMPPVPLTEIAVAVHKPGGPSDVITHDYATEYAGARGVYDQRTISGDSGVSSHLAPTPPPHSGGTRRQFSFHNVFKRNASPSPQPEEEVPPPPRSAGHLARFGLGSRGSSTPHVKNATEEERLGLVTGDSRSMPALPRYGADDDDDDEYPDEDKRRMMELVGSSSPPEPSRYGRGITSPPRRRGSDDDDDDKDEDEDVTYAYYDTHSRRYGSGSSGRGSPPPPPPPPHRTPPSRKPVGGNGF